MEKDVGASYMTGPHRNAEWRSGAGPPYGAEPPSPSYGWKHHLAAVVAAVWTALDATLTRPMLRTMGAPALIRERIIRLSRSGKYHRGDLPGIVDS